MVCLRGRLRWPGIGTLPAVIMDKNVETKSPGRKAGALNFQQFVP
jgi:hypothetical protein